MAELAFNLFAADEVIQICTPCACREAFIREQMRKRLGQDADELAASSSQMHPEDELYAVPSDLQVCTSMSCRKCMLLLLCCLALHFASSCRL